ncbi:MAG: family 78 glycoside hydrolase catalytic domain [Chitinophagaceae bacterium]
MRKYIFIIQLLLFFSQSVFSSTGDDIPYHLQCEFTTNPIGVDVTHLRFNWAYPTSTTFKQKGFRIMVATTEEKLSEGKPDIIDSIFSSANPSVTLVLSQLKSYTRYYWVVRPYSENTIEGKASRTAWFETGKILGQEEWKAKWITDNQDKEFRPAPLFRKLFSARSKPKLARIYISGLGYYSLFMNGKKVGKGSLDPGYTDFSKRVLYLSYDVTPQIEKGQNSVAVELGNGWFNNQTPTVWKYNLAPWRARPQLICELHIAYADGTSEVIISDDSWKTSTGALQYDNLYVGSSYDARLEPEGWKTISFDDSKWMNATITKSPAPLIQSQIMPEIGTSRAIKPRSIKQLSPNTYLYDLGENIAGVVKLKVKGDAGTKITIRYGERLSKDGKLDQSNINMHLRGELPNEKVIQRDEYILKGKGLEEFIPPFTYHGFQYIEITSNAPIPFGIDNLEGIVLHSLVNPIGEFECSNELLNKIYDNCKRSYLSNLFGIPTDCPHREKNGWMADGYMVQEAGMLNYASRNIYEKWVSDMVDAQEPNGDVPGVVPTSWNWDSNWAGPIWDAAIFIVPDLLYKYYGDIRPYTTIYETAKKYLTFIETTKDERGLLTKGLGDWLYYQSVTPIDFMTSCYLYQDYKIMAKMSRLLKKGDEDIFSAKAEILKEKINTYFFHPDSAYYANKTQLSNALPLYIGIVPKQYERQVAANLAESIRQNNFSLDFGFIGSAVIPQVLSDYGYNDVMYQLVTKTTMPSYGYWIKEWNATSLFETWDVNKNIGDASLNHPSMGSISAWLMKSLAGINIDSNSVAFEKMTIQPAFIDELNYVKASHMSIRGKISSQWERKGSQINLRVTIPGNCKAMIILPGKNIEVTGGDHSFTFKAHQKRF